MKYGLELKMLIFVIALFGLAIVAMVMYKPFKIRYYEYRLQSDNSRTRQAAAEILLNMGEKKHAFDYYEDRYSSKEVKERIAAVDELCAVGDKGKALMREIFRNRCLSEMVRIPAGSFRMGSDKGQEDEKPVHKVTLKAFYMDKYEVTNEKYFVFVKSSGREAPGHWQGGAMPKDDELYPVVWVSWDDAKAYADWLGMRLPTEAEWEYACRASSETEYWFGDNLSELDDYAWYKNNSGGIHPVGGKKQNAWGLYDMHGNVWEWCQDWYDEDYYAQSPSSDPKGPESGAYRVLRGSGGKNDALNCRSAKRFWGNPVNRSGYVYGGFRLSRSLD